MAAEGQRPTDLEGLRRRAHLVTALLHEAYGSPRHDNKDDPLDELVFIVLSQMTTRQSYGRVYDRLRTTYPSWEALLDLPLAELKEAIRDAGLINQKAPRIKAVLASLKGDFGSVTLEPLRGMADDEAERYLTALPGVGLKTAKCVLALSSLRRQVLPVDTHVWRVSRRLELVGGDLPYSRVHGALEEVVPPEDRYSFHVNNLTHGKLTCIALRPRCHRCPLIEVCPYPRQSADHT